MHQILHPEISGSEVSMASQEVPPIGHHILMVPYSRSVCRYTTTWAYRTILGRWSILRIPHYPNTVDVGLGWHPDPQILGILWILRTSWWSGGILGPLMGTYPWYILPLYVRSVCIHTYSLIRGHMEHMEYPTEHHIVPTWRM